MKPKKSCIAEWQIASSSSVLKEQRTLGTPWADFPTRFEAATIDRETFTPVQAVAQVKVPDGPVLWFNPDKSEAVVDAAFSSALQVVDVTRLPAGEVKTLGTLSPERAMHAVNYGQEILELLVRADILRTYWHIGSELCLINSARDETMISGRYRAELSGEHTYFTSKKHVGRFAFRVEISPDGVLSVEGLPVE